MNEGLIAVESSIHQVLVITKRDDDLTWITPHLKKEYRKKWITVRLQKNNQGQAYSILCGLNEAINIRADAVLLLLADQPFVTINIINLLIQPLRKNPSKFFYTCSFQGVLRPPVLFTKGFFPILMGLQGDKGVRHLLNGKYKEKGEIYNFYKEEYFMDIDTMGDYEYMIFKMIKGKSVIHNDML